MADEILFLSGTQETGFGAVPGRFLLWHFRSIKLNFAIDRLVYLYSKLHLNKRINKKLLASQNRD